MKLVILFLDLILNSILNLQKFTQLVSDRASIQSHACMLSHWSCVQLSVTLWTVAHQAPQSMGHSRQEYWSELLCPPPGDLPSIGKEPMHLVSLALAGRFFTLGGKELGDPFEVLSVSSCRCSYHIQDQDT